MNSFTLENKKQDNRIWASAITAFILVQILFFIDEGYYDFRWMKSVGNWIVFVFYMAFLWGGQLLVMYTVFKNKKRFSIIGSFLGLFIGFVIAIFVFS